jgi:hypothetical protein
LKAFPGEKLCFEDLYKSLFVLTKLAGKSYRVVATMTVPFLAPVEADADEEDTVDGQQDSPRDHTHRQQPAGGTTV